MDVKITGAGWITPLGTDIAQTWQRIVAGEAPPISEIAGPAGKHAHYAARIPQALVNEVARNPRLRRSSNISLFAATAALAAMREAGLDPANPGRCALVCAVSDGGVIYTRKFYDQVVAQGSGSPLLFPETVYNAPGSHIAALLGLEGITYTLVGDASAGMSAVAMGVDLLAAGGVDHCLIVAAEEADWILCEAYGQWRLAARSPEAALARNRGALVADGAAALVLSRAGAGCTLAAISQGTPFFRRAEAAASLVQAIGELPKGIEPKRIISCANGTFIDAAERSAVAATCDGLTTVAPKATLGESFAAGALTQIICAMQSVREDASAPVLVPVIGLNHQAAAAIVTA